MVTKVLGQETCDFLSNLDTVKDEKKRSPHICSSQTILLGNKKNAHFQTTEANDRHTVHGLWDLAQLRHQLPSN